ncbi:MAG: cytochrome c oxidase subunit II [Bauldia sp.]
MGRAARLLAAAGTLLAMPAVALAQEAVPGVEPHATDFQVYFGEPASPIMERIINFNNGVMIVITLITLFVMALLGWVMIRYNARRNPTPSKTTHNTLVEVLWTVVPVLILVGIAIPSFSLLFAQYDPARAIDDYDPAAAITVKATGYQWYWGYEYPDNGIREFTSTPLRDAEPRLLAVNLPMVVPVDTVIRMQVTGAPTGVIHAFSLNHMGVKLDAVPGRITESWFLAEREGIFYGQCSELCGREHYNMPIELRVVSQEQFAQWVEAASTSVQNARALLDQWEAERIAAAQVAAR